MRIIHARVGADNLHNTGVVTAKDFVVADLNNLQQVRRPYAQRPHTAERKEWSKLAVFQYI